MRGGLRHRRENHAGIPQGSTMQFGTAKCQIALLWNQGLNIGTGDIHKEGEEETTEVTDLVTRWDDQSGNTNHANQSAVENAPRQNADKSVEFYNHSDTRDYADSMTFTKFTVSANTPFMSFLVCNLASNSTSCYLSDDGTEVFQYTSGNVHQLKTGSTSNVNHSSTFSIANGEKHLFVVERDAGDNIKVYKNGLLHDPSATNTGDFDLINLGAKQGTSNWFDGAIYDVIFIDGEQSDYKRKRVEDYLLKKHKLNRLGNG